MVERHSEAILCFAAVATDLQAVANGLAARAADGSDAGTETVTLRPRWGQGGVSIGPPYL